MKTAWLGYKLWRLIGLSRRPEALAIYPNLSALDSNSAFCAALEQYSAEQLNQLPELNWPIAPISPSNLGRWITQTFVDVDGPPEERSDQVTLDAIRYATPTDYLRDPPNRLSGEAADCVASFVEETYRLGRDIFLSADLHAFIYGVDQLYPTLSFEPLKSLADAASVSGLRINQEPLLSSAQKTRLTVVGAAPEPKGDVLLAEHGFHSFLEFRKLGPSQVESGWYYAFFNLRGDGSLDQVTPNAELSAFIGPSAGCVTGDASQRITPEQGLQGAPGETGTLLLVAFRNMYQSWEELGDGPLTVSPVSSDHTVERAALARFGLWLAAEHKAGRAAIAARPFSCVRSTN